MGLPPPVDCDGGTVRDWRDAAAEQIMRTKPRADFELEQAVTETVLRRSMS